MRVSAKGQYGIASMVCLAREKNKDQFINIATICEYLGISKIYLEQVFALLKRSGLVESLKGSAGGYKLSKPASEITAYDILLATEQTLFEKSAHSLSDKAKNIENAVFQLVYDKTDDSISKTLSSVTLNDLLHKSEELGGNFMYYI